MTTQGLSCVGDFLYSIFNLTTLIIIFDVYRYEISHAENVASTQRIILQPKVLGK